MAHSFFDFDALKEALGSKKGEKLLLDDDDDDGFENEEDYDALNDETFGACDPSDDWEQQHEQFAEINENSKHTDEKEHDEFPELNESRDEIANSISQFFDTSSDTITYPSNSSVWAYTPVQKNNDSSSLNSVLSSLQKVSKSFIESYADNALPDLNKPPNTSFSNQPRKFCTVEELEKNLLKNSKPPPLQPVQPQSPYRALAAQFHGRPLISLPQHGMQPYPLPHPNMRLPPPPNMPPPGLMPRPLAPPHMVGRFRSMHPHQRPPGFLFPMPVNYHMQFPPPPPGPHNMPPPGLIPNRVLAPPRDLHPNNMHAMPPYSQQIPQQRIRHDSGNYSRPNMKEYEHQNRDEYAGLMTAKDKQWLLNIQMLQLNTGTPYFDDYYYTIFKERQLKNIKENALNHNERERNGRFPNNGGRQRRNSERQDGNTLTPRVYTPLQFENSLGKLQCGSVTAPRKIIDMDIVTPDKDQEASQPTKDSRKTKQLLLELEALYSLLLRAEDIKNPVFINNMEKLREMKQKQRLRELEQATTTEQKQEVLRLFKLESQPVVENQNDYIQKIVNGWLLDDKFVSFLNIRKGKMLLLRLLPHLNVENFSTQLVEIWSKILLSLPIIGRRDTAGDNILIKFYPPFKRYVQSCTISDILDIISGLVEVVKQENNRSTPLSHVGKAPLYFVLLNKFGVSALVVLFIRCEYLFSSSSISEKQQTDWSNFLASMAKHSENVSKMALPLETIPHQIFTKHINRLNISEENGALLKKHFVDITAMD